MASAIKLPEGFILDEPNLPPGFLLDEPGEMPPPEGYGPVGRPYPKFVGTAAIGAAKGLHKGIWAGLSAFGYPLKSVEDTLATPLEPAIRAIDDFQSGRKDWRETKSALGKVPQGMLMGLKSWLHFSKRPEGAKDMRDVMAAYYEGVKGPRGPQMPTWQKEVLGTGLSFLVTPMATAGLLRLLGKGAKALPVVSKLSAPEQQLWRRMVTRARGRTTGRIETAKQLGRSVRTKEAQKVSAKLYKEYGKKIGPKAVKKRLTQIVKGGITAEPGAATYTPEEIRRIAKLASRKLGRTVTSKDIAAKVVKVRPGMLQAKANPIIEEFAANEKLLRKYGILGEETYLTKLPKKRIAQLFKKQEGLQKQLGKLEKRRFPGRVQQIRKIQKQIDGISAKIHTSYVTGEAGYFPRMYATKEEAALARKRLPFGRKRIRAQYAKKRKEIPFEVRRKMGEITEVDYPVQKRLIQEGADIETAKLFKQVQRRGWASSEAKSGWKRLPETKGFGVLSGKYVPNKIYADITTMIDIRNDYARLFDTLLGTWKSGKVLWNPATHFRNMFSNSVLLDLSGMNHAKQLIYFKRAIGHISKNSKEYQYARKHFPHASLARGELLEGMLQVRKTAGGHPLTRAIDMLTRGSQKLSKGPGAVYEYEEFLPKFMKFLQVRKFGKSPMAAIEQANKWLFDYGDLAEWERKIARRVMPFYTFPRKALPRVAEAMTTRPYTFAKYPLLASLTTKYSLAKLELTAEDYEQLARILPDYMDSGSYVLMPYRDDNGDLRFLDWTYLIPWGPADEIQERGVLDFFVSNPALQIFGDLKRNKDSFTDRPIWDDSIPESKWTPDYRREQNAKKWEHCWRVLSPSLTPGVGLYWDKLQDAATGKPSKAGKKRLLPETIAHTIFGLRTQAIDPEMQRVWNSYGLNKQVQSLNKALIDIAIRRGRGNITEEEYERRQRIYTEQLQKLFELD